MRCIRALAGCVGLSLVLAGLLGPALVSADPLTSWTAGPDAAGDNTYDGFIDVPSTNASVPSGNFLVAGWFVDKTAQGWAGADDAQVFLGQMGSGGTMLTKAIVAQNRPDVAAAEGNPYFGASGFTAIVPAGALQPGNQTLSVYVHTPGKGWWFKSVPVAVASNAPAAAAAPSPSTAAAAAPAAGGAALPTIVIEEPKPGQNVPTRGTFDIIGYALDKAAAPNQGVQGTGIDRVQVYMDAERDNGGTYLGDATLAFEDQAAASTYGQQFASAGWRVTIKPTQFHAGLHELFAYARSAVSGKENLTVHDISIVE